LLDIGKTIKETGNFWSNVWKGFMKFSQIILP
jgi:hypothetical protein